MVSFISLIEAIVRGFWGGFFEYHSKVAAAAPIGAAAGASVGAGKQLRDNLSEDQIDGMVDDSFPASDPPSTY